MECSTPNGFQLECLWGTRRRGVEPLGLRPVGEPILGGMRNGRNCRFAAEGGLALWVLFLHAPVRWFGTCGAWYLQRRNQSGLGKWRFWSCSRKSSSSIDPGKPGTCGLEVRCAVESPALHFPNVPWHFPSTAWWFSSATWLFSGIPQSMGSGRKAGNARATR